MPYIRASAFALGAVVGAAATLVITRRQQSTSSSPLHTPLAGSASPASAGIVPSSNLVSPANTGILKYGNPGPIADLLARKAYVAGYDRRLRHPAWTAEHLTRASLGRSLLEPSSEQEINSDRSKSTFEEDGNIPDTFRARLSDYFRSGYDRGHMVPAADAKMSQEAMNETFLLSNIAPQVGDGFNRHYWAYLERWCRDLTLSFSDVYVFTIPLYLPIRDVDGKYRVKYEVIGTPPNVAVPTHFAKVILAARPASPATPHIAEISTGAFVLPNAPIPDETPLKSFTAPVDAVEKAAGLQIFSEQIKQSSKHICQTTECRVVVKRFNDAQKSTGISKSISSRK